MILFINACARKESRTLGLARKFLDGISEEIRELDLYEIGVPLLDEVAIDSRAKAAERKDETDPFVSLAMDFAAADHIVIAAPYWDLGYPAILRSYIEAIMVIDVTFGCKEDGSYQGLCRAKDLVYITTAGGHIDGPNLGYEHIKAVAKSMWGIKTIDYFSAEALDLEGANTQAILDKATEDLMVFKASGFLASFQDRKIMIVDDSKVNILKAEHILRENGFETMSAESGKECLKTLLLHRADLILLDIEMPGMNGFETIEEIRRHPNLADIPVVFVTGDNDMEIVVKASKYKVSGYVVKPFSEDELLLHVRKGLTSGKKKGPEYVS